MMSILLPELVRLRLDNDPETSPNATLRASWSNDRWHAIVMREPLDPKTVVNSLRDLIKVIEKDIQEGAFQ